MAAPIRPRNNPATEKVHPRKFNVKVDGMTCMTISKGTIQPENSRTRPRLRKKRGEFIDYILLRTERRSECSSKTVVEVQVAVMTNI